MCPSWQDLHTLNQGLNFYVEESTREMPMGIQSSRRLCLMVRLIRSLFFCAFALGVSPRRPSPLRFNYPKTTHRSDVYPPTMETIVCRRDTYALWPRRVMPTESWELELIDSMNDKVAEPRLRDFMKRYPRRYEPTWMMSKNFYFRAEQLPAEDIAGREAALKRALNGRKNVLN